MVSASVIVTFFLLLSQNINGQTLYPTSTGVVGAVYTMSNGQSMNQVIISCLNATGQLTMVGAINTNGTGVSTTAGDPLFSQGSMVVCSNYLFVVNAGSNTLSMFMINPSNATQLTLLSVQQVYGWFPVSVAVNAMYACVLTGGNVTGIRCFTYNSSGLFIVSTFDRNLTSYISQSIPPTGLQTMSEILFSADNLALIVSIKGFNTTAPGCLLIYSLTNNNNVLAPNATQSIPPNSGRPFSMTLVGMNGLLITDPAAGGVLTLNYSSTTGMTSNNMFTPINTTLAAALCWSVYSPKIGNYYVIAGGTSTIVELNLNLGSSSSPVKIIQYYQLPNSPGALDTTVVSFPGYDYLYVLGPTTGVISGYQLNTAGNATPNGVFSVQQGNVANMPKIEGIAAFLQTTSSSPTSSLLLSSMTTIMICMMTIFSFCGRDD